MKIKLPACVLLHKTIPLSVVDAGSVVRPATETSKNDPNQLFIVSGSCASKSLTRLSNGERFVYANNIQEFTLVIVVNAELNVLGDA